MKETTESKNYVLPKFYNCKGNLKSRWYIEFQAFNTDTNTLQLKRIVCPAKYETKKQRDIWGKENCSKITRLLEKGYCFGTEREMQNDNAPANEILTITLTTTIENLRPTLRSKSILTYTSALNKFSTFLTWANVTNKENKDVRGVPETIDQFTRQDSVRFRDYLMSELKNSPRTANNTVEHLNTIYVHLSTRTTVPDSPFKVKSLKEEVTTRNIAITKEDQGVIESYLIEHEPELYLFTRCIYYAFIRPGELNQITLADVRLEDNYIVIRGVISKNGKTETVQIIPALFKELAKLDVADTKQFYYLFGKGLVPSRYEAAKQVAFRRHEKVLKACGLEDRNYTLYSWKHTGAVNAYLAGVGVKELQKLLRHSSVAITDIYLKSLGLRTDPNIQNYSW